MSTPKVHWWTNLVFLLAGCMGTQAGHLYDMKTGQTSTIQIEAPEFSNGKVKGTLPDGASCEGQFSEVSRENARKITTVSPMLTENSVASAAVLNCGPGKVLRCTLARRQWREFSYGECQDQQGTEYSLVF
jgi:hypothetical protein